MAEFGLKFNCKYHNYNRPTVHTGDTLSDDGNRVI